MSDPMHICNSMMSHSYTNAVHNLPQYFQYAKGHAHAKHASASLPPQQRQDQQYFKPVSPSRNKPSSLNTQLYTAENFMKISSPRRGCYIYNSNNEITVLYERKKHKIDEIINKIKSVGMEIYDISTDEGNLEDVFIDVTKS